MKIAAGIAGLILLIAIIVLGAFFGKQVLFIILILAALMSLAAFALLGYAAMQVVGLVQEVRGEVKVLTATAHDTLSEVQGTARFISDTVVQPVTQAAGFVAATRATVKSFTEPLYKRRS